MRVFLVFVTTVAIFTGIFNEVVKYIDARDLTVPKITIEKPTNEITSENGDEVEILTLFKTILQNDDDIFSIYLYRPTLSEEPIIYHSQQMRPASMIKVFVLAKLLEDVKNGKISLAENVIIDDENLVGGAGIIADDKTQNQYTIQRLAEVMIIYSDNTATNILIDKVGGFDELNKYLAENGYYDTQFKHKMMMQTRYSGSNTSSVTDLGTIFTRIYRHECVSYELDEFMIDCLLRQNDRECFPAVLSDWEIAHKTGEVDCLYDDGGIFYNESKGDFILVIMNDNYSGRFETIEKMQRIARMIALNYMTPLE